LEGKFIDYRNEISKLTIIDGEPLRSFYSRVIWLFNKIQLAKIQDGSNAVLFEHFLTLLRATGNHVILAETSITWKKIKAHRRLPNYMNIPLPWTLNEILRDLETANITILHMPSNPHEHNLPTPVVFKAMNNKYGHHQRLPTSHPNNREYKPPPIASTQKNKCLLCNNQHPNPWHPTEQCPFKDPSLIQNKLIRDNVLQPNTLDGKTNNKLGLKLLTQHPYTKIVKLEDLNIPTLDHENNQPLPPEPATNSDDQLEHIFHPIPDTSSDTEEHDEDAQCIDTQYFDVPTPTANFSKTNLDSPMSGSAFLMHQISYLILSIIFTIAPD
jgi:hypothetical protein